MDLFTPKALIDKIAALLPKGVAPLIRRKHDQALVRAAAAASAPAFGAVWSNPEDDVYDKP